MSILQQFEVRDCTYHRNYLYNHCSTDYEIVCAHTSLFVHKYVLLGTDFIEKYGDCVNDKKMTTTYKHYHIISILNQLYGRVDDRLDYKPLFDRTDISDFKFICIDGEIPAHKMVLMDKCKFIVDYTEATHMKSMMLDYPVSVILPIIRLFYGFVHEVNHKYNLLHAAQLFQLNGSIEKYILPELQHDSPDAMLCILSTLDDHAIKYLKDMVIKWMLKYVSMDNIINKIKHITTLTLLCNTPFAILKPYLESDFLKVNDETRMLKFMHRYAHITGRCPVEDGLINCVRIKYCAVYSKYKLKFKDSLTTLTTEWKPRLSTLFGRYHKLEMQLMMKLYNYESNLREYLGTIERLALYNYTYGVYRLFD